MLMPKNFTRICKNCNTSFNAIRKTNCCTSECIAEYKRNYENTARFKRSLLKYPDDCDVDTFVECKICGYRSSDIATHIRMHNITSTEYIPKYGPTKSVNTRNNLKGDKNPAYQHGGRLSPFSKNFINYVDGESIEALKEQAKKTMNGNHNNSTRIDYYLHRGLSQVEAEIALSERQTTFTLEKCIIKHGQEEGTKVWSERQEKWSKSFKKQNFSKISQILFHKLYEQYNTTEIYFATKDLTINNNQEYRLILHDGSLVLPDFICLDTKKIIEFDGDYWHSEKIANPAKELDRDERIKKSGYSILHIKEYDFNKTRDYVITKCLNFLTQQIENS